jgi:tape measure domain-containing protein
MADPKIKYDIEANVKGDAEVNRLASALDGLANTLEGDIKTQALASAAALRELGAQNAAINAFIELKREGRDAAVGLLAAQQAAEKLGAELAQIEKPTRKQAGELQKLHDEVRAGTRSVDANKQSMVQARATLDQYGIATTGLSTTQDAMRAALARARDEAQKMVPALEGVAKQSTESKAAIAAAGKVMDESFRVLGMGAVRSLEGELRKLQTALAQIRANADILPADKRAAVAAFNTQIAKLKLEAQGAGQGMKALETSADSTGNALAQAGQKALAWGAALGGLAAIKSVTSDVIETGAQFETLRVRLENLLGGTQQAAEAFDMIKNLAATTPFEVAALTESFVKLTAMGMKPTEAQMRSLSDVAANLGGGTEVLSGVTTALGQAWAKSKLQGEEIMQLAERGVPVWDALTQATGRTVPELQRMSAAGLLGRDVITKLIDALGQQNLGASAKLMATYSGAVSNAKDAMAEFYDLISQSGVLDFLTRKLQDLLAEFERMKNTGELEQKAKALADGFISVASAVEQAAKVIAHLGPTLLKLGEIMVAMKIASWTQSLYGIGAAAVASAAGVSSLGTAAAATAVKMEVAAVAGARVAGVLRLLRSLSGIGLVIGAVELAAEFLRAKNAAEEGDKAVEKMLRSRPENGPKKAAQEVTAALAGVPQKADDMRKSFDMMIEKGDSAAEAIGKIGKDFNLSTTPGIRDAATVLDGLVVDGKITADQFNKAWTDALKGVDLKDFELRARQAFDGSYEGALRLKSLLDVPLREAIIRAGLDFDVISGGMGKASQSAINDTDAVIKGLESLKAKGVDTGLALTASIGKGINTADSQKAIEAIRLQIEGVRQVLGDKVADGLLDQAAQKADQLKAALDKAKPGVDSVAEAMKNLGIVSDKSLTDTARIAKESYDAMVASGTSSARELGEAFKKAAEKAIAANNGVAPSWVAVQASARGYELQVDSAGRTTVRAMGEGAKAVGDLGEQYKWTTEQVKGQEDAMDRIAMKYTLSANYTQRQIDLLAREADAIQKVIDTENKRLNRDKEGFSLDTSGQRVNMAVESKSSIYDKAKQQGLTEEQALRLSNNTPLPYQGISPHVRSAIGDGGENWGTRLQDEINKLKLQNAANPTAKTATTPAAPQQKTDAELLEIRRQEAGALPGETVQQAQRRNAGPAQKSLEQVAREEKATTVNINLNGGTQSINTDAAGARVLQDVLSQLANARATSSR